MIDQLKFIETLQEIKGLLTAGANIQIVESGTGNFIITANTSSCRSLS